MVWEVKCAECGDILEFGGSDPERIPENAVEWNDEVYCEECVRKFVKLGTGDIKARVEYIEEILDEVTDELGIEFNLRKDRK
ncbi:MAG: hypothetical protein ACLFRK_02690 [Candidatus Nanohaloarchaea archaeon]